MAYLRRYGFMDQTTMLGRCESKFCLGWRSQGPNVFYLDSIYEGNIEICFPGQNINLNLHSLFDFIFVHSILVVFEILQVVHDKYHLDSTVLYTCTPLNVPSCTLWSSQSSKRNTFGTARYIHIRKCMMLNFRHQSAQWIVTDPG